jgi:hypothetical protein
VSPTHPQLPLPRPPRRQPPASTPTAIQTNHPSRAPRQHISQRARHRDTRTTRHDTHAQDDTASASKSSAPSPRRTPESHSQARPKTSLPSPVRPNPTALQQKRTCHSIDRRTQPEIGMPGSTPSRRDWTGMEWTGLDTSLPAP